MNNNQERSEELWGWIDERTGKRVSVTSCLMRHQAEQQLAHWRLRDARGGRPDLHDLMPHIVVTRLSVAASSGGGS